jgi:hypothetical protein
VLLAALLGCTAPAKYWVAPGHEGAPGVRRVLLCPVNVAVSLPAELSTGAEPVDRALVAYLEERGLEVERLDLTEARAHWQEAAVHARREGADGAAAIFVETIGQQRDFDALLMPSLILRSVRVDDSSGTWDGVRRQVTTVNAPSRGLGGSTDTLSKGIAFGGLSADVLASSLHVMAFAPDGQRVFEGQGGFEFIQDADLSAAGKRSGPLGTRYGLFRDAEVVREGVQIALGPYLPPSGER